MTFQTKQTKTPLIKTRTKNLVHIVAHPRNNRDCGVTQTAVIFGSSVENNGARSKT
jgi:hypothetical protein